MKFQPFAIRFDEAREAELVAEALAQLHADNAADALRIKNIRRLIEEELEGATR